MALDLNRWFKYAKARLDNVVGQGNASLDRLEAEREADLADKPWLRSTGDAPTLDEARARIEWEADQQRRASAGASGAPAAVPPASAPGSPAAPGVAGPSGPGDPAADAAAAEMAEAALELDAREKASAERLAAIRRELGVDEPAAPPADPPADGPT